MTIVALLVGALIAALINALLIWVIGKLGVGIEVEGFGPALLTAFLLALFTAFTYFVWGLLNYTPETGWVGAVSHIVTSAAGLLAAGSIVKGLRVKGFLGAVLAIVAISAVGWLANWLISLVL